MPAALTRNVLLCLSYALTGWLSLQIAVPPGYAAPLFPPAGIALAVLFVYGRSLLPGVFLGSLLVQAVAALNSGIEGAAWLGILLPPLGATAQASLGLILARRLLGLPTLLYTQEAIIRFVGIVAPVSSLISATVGTGTLIGMGAISGSDALFTWINWWAGDTLGVLIMVPLVLSLTGRPTEDWKARRLAIMIPMAIALALLSFTFVQVRHWENARIQASFNRDAEHLARLIQKRLDAQLDQMAALERFAAVHTPLSRKSWHDFVTPLLERYPGTQNFTWNPWITDRQRTAFEKAAAQETGRDFHILGRDPHGNTFTAARKADYLPILYIEPLEKNLPALGLDPLTLETTAAAALRTRATGLPAASESIRLVQENQEQRGIVLYQAVFAEKPSRQIGMISSAFRMDDTINAVLSATNRDTAQLCLLENTRSQTLQRLYGPNGCEQAELPKDRPHWRTTLDFAEHRWELNVVATPAYMTALRSWGVWATLAAGLLCTGILGAFLLLTSGRTHKVELLVAERTRQLEEATQALQARQHELSYLAHFDALTGLPNRTQWNERVQTELRSASRHSDTLALLFLDLDHFKAVNDSLGHAVGDQLLKVVAQRFSKCLREEDFLARLGGDEFVVILPRLGQGEDAALVAQKLIATLEHPIMIDGHDLTVSVSIGIALYPDDGTDSSTLLRHADTAMYGAKDEGRNTFHYFMQEMDGHALELLLLENALRKAIDNDELVLHYQPQVTEDGKLAGCEALIRWQRPDVGLVMPNDFIGIAEKNGLILPLGEWVLNEACRQQAAWARAGLPLIVAVNISALQFRQHGFRDVVKAAIDRSAMDPHYLELELTESTLMQPTPEVVERMNQLRAWGIRLALDDFGTGYSSLSHLKRLPIQRLKIDRSFVKDLPDDPDDVTIASATLSLARDLNMEAVAEGVENQAQMDFLSDRHCAVMQGYLFSRPLPAGEFAAWARDHLAEA